MENRFTTMDVVEHHVRAVEEMPGAESASHRSEAQTTALPFLRRTLTALETGPVDGVRPHGSHDRDAFRSALVNSLQEGFFVVDRDGTVVEVNEAFAAITGCTVDGLPYRWPYPWVVDEEDAAARLTRLVRDGGLRSETPIQHPDGRVTWAAVSINSVTEEGDDRGAYVGTIRDVTTERYTEVRRSAVLRLATALGLATSVSEVLDDLLDVVASAIEVQRVVAAVWAQPGRGPSVLTAGAPTVTWKELDPRLRNVVSEARSWPPLTVEPVLDPDGSGYAAGMLTVLSGADDAVLWLEFREPRVTSDEDGVLVAALIGHLSAALQHVRQFQTAREASLTLQRSMMPTTKPPVGFAVRYEPAVSPLEVGGTGTTCSRSATTRSAWSSVTVWEAGSRPRPSWVNSAARPAPCWSTARHPPDFSTNSMRPQRSSRAPTARRCSSAPSTPTPVR